MRALLALCALLAAGGAARAATSVAVMPLRDLAGGKPNVGAALRETLTVDMRGAVGVRVVEREAIDRVLREQAVDPARALEGVLGVRIGTLLGATHLVTGAYQRQGNTLRVTVRLIVVETGAIVGSAKVDGELERMLELEDRVSQSLLVSLGWKAPPAPPVKRARPRLTVKTIERYGDAALEPDPEKKKVILRDVVAQSPTFSYAVDALAALEGRLAGYEATSAAKLSQEEKAALSVATDGKQSSSVRAAKINALLPAMRSARRYRALLSACDALTQALGELKHEIQFYRFVALEGLRRIDEALAAGEKLIAEAPTSPHFAESETRLRNLAQVRRTMATRRAEYEADLKEKRDGLGGKPPSAPAKLVQWDFAPCIATRWNRQYNELMVVGCREYISKHGEDADKDAADHARAARLFVILGLGELGRFDEARREIAAFRKHYPLGDEEIDGKLAEWPTD